jgi:molybdopterin/thiamine biosynthesis adenylyltransferase
MSDPPKNLSRYDRQMAFVDLGPAGQRRLRAGRAVIVGVGGLGSWVAEMLARAGVGFLRLVDPDYVDTTNLHRQAMYDQADADSHKPKVQAAAEHLAKINSATVVEGVETRLDRENVSVLAGGVDVILDGTDNFPTRFILNDYAVREGRPWVFAGVVGAEAQTLTVLPGQTACLRCVFDAPPPPCIEPTCRTVGVLPPAVVAVAGIEAMEAMKILAGCAHQVSPFLLKMDLWNNTLQRIDATRASAAAPCPCCKRRHFEFLET